MGIIRVPPSPFFYAHFYDNNGVRRRLSLQTTNLRIARLKYAEIIRRRDRVKNACRTHIKWELFKKKLFAFMSVDKARNTVNRAKLAIRYLEEIKKPHFLHDVTPELLQKYKEHLMTKNISKRHLNSLVICIKTAMHRGEKWGLIGKQDWTVVKKLKAPRGRVVFHTPEEIDKLLAACPNDMWKIVVLLGADAGLRRGEMADLKWEDVDFNNNQLYIAPNKTESHRFVPLTQDLRDALAKAQTSAKSAYVIDLYKPRKGITHGRPNYLTIHYAQIAKSCGVDSFLHKLRHTFASQLVQNGVELYTVSKLLGHSSIQMTEIYAHMAPPTLHRAIAKLPERQIQLK
ncbi:MAG: site-specific integrase [Elusimicrobiaceae bacterium]|nr:site-specific integrase [Elusimicrobiaceae bacterium]